jgi:hypothetical protein
VVEEIEHPRLVGLRNPWALIRNHEHSDAFEADDLHTDFRPGR